MIKSRLFFFLHCILIFGVSTWPALGQFEGPCFGGGIGGGCGSCGDGICAFRSETCQSCPSDCGPCQGTSCLQPPLGLSAWWTFDQQGPWGYPDFAGHNTALKQGNPSVVAGKVNNAVRFDSLGEHLKVLDQPELDFGTGDFSIVFWIQSGAQIVGPVLSKVDTTLKGYQVGANTDLSAGLGTGNGFMSSVSADNTLNGGWQMVAVTVNRRFIHGFKLYVDGVEKNAHSFLLTRASLSNASDLMIGSTFTDIPGFASQMSLDELQIYKRALSGSEVRAIYDSGSHGLCRPTGPGYCPGGAACSDDFDCGFDPGLGLLGGCYSGICACK